MTPNVDIPVQNYIVDNIGAVVALMREAIDGPPYYMYGHRTEVAGRLTALSNFKTTELKKYPIIVLVMDIPETVMSNVSQYSLNVGIITITDKSYNAEQRMVNVFKPILYPLYYDFLRALKNSGLFMWPKGQKFPEHIKIDRPFWGTGYTGAGSGTAPGSVKNLFDDPVDAIELVNLKVNSTFKTC